MITLFRSLKRRWRIVLLMAVPVVGLGCRRGTTDGSQNEPTSIRSSTESLQHARSASDFVLALQQALKSGDRNRIIAVTRFPVQAGPIEGTDEAFRRNYEAAMLDERAFVREYDKIWNPQTVKAMMDENPDHIQWPPGALWVNIGCGEVWFEKSKDEEFRITAFNISEYSNAGISLADCYRARDFFTRLQGEVARDNRKEVATMLRYPISFRGQAKTITLHNQQDTLHHYDLIFSARLRRAVANQKAWDLRSQADGVEIEGGFIWFNEPAENGLFAVTSIFEPPLHY